MQKWLLKYVWWTWTFEARCWHKLKCEMLSAAPTEEYWEFEYKQSRIIRKQVCHRSYSVQSEKLAKRTADIWNPWWKYHPMCGRIASQYIRGRNREWVENSSPTLLSRDRENSGRMIAFHRSTLAFCYEAQLHCPCSETIEMLITQILCAWRHWRSVTFDLKLSRIPCWESSNELILTRWSSSSKPGIRTVMLRGPLNPRMFVSYKKDFLMSLSISHLH